MVKQRWTLDLSTNIGGLALRNPVMMASGTFGHAAEYADLVDLSRLGGVVTKTITFSPRAGNKPPRTAETPSGMLNSIGLTNPGLDGFIEEKLPLLAALPTACVVSIAGTSSEEFAEMAQRFDGLPGVDAIELNISSPNMKDGGMLFGCSESAACEVTAAVRQATRLPVFVKLTPNVICCARWMLLPVTSGVCLPSSGMRMLCASSAASVNLPTNFSMMSLSSHPMFASARTAWLCWPACGTCSNHLPTLRASAARKPRPNLESDGR